MITLRRYIGFFGGTVPWYSVLVGVAVAAMGIWLYLGLKREFRSVDDNKVLICFPFAMIFGVVVAAGFDSVFRGTWRTWFNSGEKEFGFAFFGWAIGFLIFVATWGRFAGLGAKKTLDFFAPSLALAQGFGRIGCFLGGCCYGCPNDKFGVRYPPGSLPYEKVGDIALFPVQLIESLMLFLLFFVCVSVRKQVRCSVYLIGVSVNRLVLECFRFDNRGVVFGQDLLSPSQVVSVILLLVGLVMFIYSFNKKEEY